MAKKNKKKTVTTLHNTCSEDVPAINEQLESNPFKALGLRFATHKAAPSPKPKPAKPKVSLHSSAIPDDDDDAFAAAMGGVQKLTKTTQKKQKTNATATVTTAPQTKAKPQPTAPAHAPSQGVPLGELGFFQQIQKELASSSKETPQKDSTPETPTPQPTMQRSAQERSRIAIQRQYELTQDAPEENDDEAFANAIHGTTPLAGRGREVHPEKEPSPAQQARHDPIRDFLEGNIEFSLEYTTEYLEGHVVGLDPLIIEKLRAGCYSYEAHVDLHGLNTLQAYEELLPFMRRSYNQGLRTVLVIPGRGRNSPDGMGILREKLQQWLTQDPFKRVVLAFCTAQPSDGGAGAVYVLMRKYKKSRGKIHWDRMPADADLFA